MTAAMYELAVLFAAGLIVGLAYGMLSSLVYLVHAEREKNSLAGCRICRFHRTGVRCVGVGIGHLFRNGGKKYVLQWEPGKVTYRCKHPEPLLTAGILFGCCSAP